MSGSLTCVGSQSLQFITYWNGSCFAPISLLGVDTTIFEYNPFFIIRGKGNYLAVVTNSRISTYGFFYWNGSDWDYQNLSYDSSLSLQLFGDYLFGYGAFIWSVFDISNKLLIPGSMNETINTPIIYNNEVWSVNYEVGEVAYPDRILILNLAYLNSTYKHFPREIVSRLPDDCVLEMIVTNQQLSFITCLDTWELWDGTKWVHIFEELFKDANLVISVAWNQTHLIIVTPNYIGVYIGTTLISKFEMEMSSIPYLPTVLENNCLFIWNYTMCELLIIDLGSKVVTSVMTLEYCGFQESLLVDGDNLYIGGKMQFSDGNTSYSNIVKYSISNKYTQQF